MPSSQAPVGRVVAKAQEVPVTYPYSARPRPKVRLAEIDTPEKGQPWYCRETTSREEARFYLERCGLTRLDGDGDGVACEGLCR